MIAISLASYLLSTQLAASVYNAHIPSYSNFHGKICLGRDCFRNTFYATTTICFVATLIGFILMHRSSSFYTSKWNRLLEKKEKNHKIFDS